jgi:hypothetical protein
MPEAAAKRVFISYSHDSPAHREQVLQLADRLRDEGVDAWIDAYVLFPPEGWPTWCEREISNADFVLMVCTETYLRRVNGEEKPGEGHGVLWEAQLIKQHLYDAGSCNRKFVPVLLADGSEAHVPTPVKGATIYRADEREHYQALYRLLTDQPFAPPRPPGEIVKLPSRQRPDGASRGRASGIAEPIPSSGAPPRDDREVREQLVTEMTETATALYLATQRFWRDKARETADRGSAAALRASLDGQYHKSLVEGKGLEARLQLHFPSTRPRELWHSVMDLLTVRYFQVIGEATERLRKANAGEKHSGLTADQLKSPQLVLSAFHTRLEEATKAVREEPTKK